MTDAPGFKSALMESLEAGIDAVLAADGPALHRTPPCWLAAVPRAHLYDDVVGPFYDLTGVHRILGGVSRQAIHDRVKRGTLLQVRTSDQALLYPTFQFDGTDIAPRLRQVLARLRATDVDGWTIATWFSTPSAELDGSTPREVLEQPGAPVEPVEQAATAAARRWAAP